MNNTTQQKQKNELLANVLKYALTESDKMWNKKEVSHAHIIGYLQAAIEIAVSELENNNNK